MSDADKRPPSLRVHSVLYGNSREHVMQTVEHLNRAADIAIAARAFVAVELVYGDCSPQPVLESQTLAALAKHSDAISKIEHRFFGKNLGSAGGHNRLLEDLVHDCVLFMNPDVMLAPNALVELAKPLSDEKAGLIEARQVPVEHPKEYDRRTGDTSWAATACALSRSPLVRELGGFDAQSFFLYCDDVDLSWRVRLAGYRVLFQPSALAFHDKRLGDDGRWAPSDAERYYSAEAALMLAHKYSRPNIVADLLDVFTASSDDNLSRASAEFRKRRETGSLPAPIDEAHTVGEFVGGFYTRHRFAL
jgi:GT2 family glycosyltransferase